MEQNWSEQIMSIINQIAEKLGVAAERVYPVLRKQAIINGFTDCLWVLLGVAVLFITYKLVQKFTKYAKEERLDGIDMFPAILGFIISSIFGTCCIMFSINSILTAFINPDWYIINNILKQLIS